MSEMELSEIQAAKVQIMKHIIILISLSIIINNISFSTDLSSDDSKYIDSVKKIISESKQNEVKNLNNNAFIFVIIPIIITIILFISAIFAIITIMILLNTEFRKSVDKILWFIVIIIIPIIGCLLFLINRKRFKK